MRSRLFLVFLVVIAMLASACGSRVDAELLADFAGDRAAAAPSREMAPPRPSGPFESSDLSSEPTPTHVTPDERVGTEPDEPELAGEHVETGPTRREARTSDFVQVTIDPKCVRVGEVVAATIQTDPRMHLTLVVSYSDGQPHGQIHFAEAGPGGVYVWRWVLDPSVPPGEALVYAASFDQTERRRDWATEPFVVAGVEGCG